MKEKEQVFEVLEMIETLIKQENVSFIDTNRFYKILSKVDPLFMKKQNALKYWDLMVNSFEKGDYNKTEKYAKKVRSIVQYVANDFPFKVKDKVCITRYEHGWCNGNTEAIIKEVHQNSTGVWSYTAQVIENGVDVEGYIIHIDHTRDANLC